ncbi:hypothetical protein OAT16_04525 [Prolixibacteraceae bacterium]|nr:hypothetical protein [Prolixibacteraceae bacterium]
MEMLVVKLMFVLFCWLGFPILLRSQIRIVAKGGASFYKPGNTVVAVRLAWEYHADGILVDVFESKDEKWFAFRPEVIRTYVPKWYDLRSMRAKKIGALSLQSKIKNGSDYHISTLEDVVSVLPKGKFFIISLDDKVKNLKSLVDHLRDHRNAVSFRFVSSNWRMVKYLSKRIDPKNIYYRWDGRNSLGVTMEKMKELEVTSLVMDKKYINPQVMEWMNDWGIKLHLSLSEKDNGKQVVRDYPDVQSLFTSRPRWVRSLLPDGEDNTPDVQVFGLVK